MKLAWKTCGDYDSKNSIETEEDSGHAARPERFGQTLAEESSSLYSKTFLTLPLTFQRNKLDHSVWWRNERNLKLIFYAKLFEYQT